jgi:hypothetical protein
VIESLLPDPVACAEAFDDPVGLEYWMVGMSCKFRAPGWVVRRSDTRW